MNVVMIDTHVAGALFKGRLTGYSRAALRLLDSARVLYSPIVALELQMLHEIGRIKPDAARVTAHLDRQFGIAEANERLSDIVRHAVTLRFSRDPFDRLIVAHADYLAVPLVTQDEHVLAAYPRALR